MAERRQESSRIRHRHLRRPRPFWHAGQPLLNARNPADCIEHLLFAQQADTGAAREKVLVSFVGRVMIGFLLIGPTVQNETNHPLAIESMLDEVFGQRVEQLGIRRRIRLPKIIYRIDDAVPQEVGPNSIDFDVREEGIVRLGEPTGKQTARRSSLAATSTSPCKGSHGFISCPRGADGFPRNSRL